MDEIQGKIEGGKLRKKEGANLSGPPGLAKALEKRFPFSPTEGQKRLFLLMEKWFLERGNSKPVFILRGYAGTGKTAFLGALVKTLPQLKLNVQLMAPTGRASKVMSQYTRRMAFTIHKRIFKYELDSFGYPKMKRQKNTFKKTLFVVDEGSMLGNQSEFGTKGLLEELISYVFENEGNWLLIIGDSAQLPPVGTDLSPALKAGELEGHFGLTVMQHELVDVVRQEQDSGILVNATSLREIIRGKIPGFSLVTKGFPDVFRMKANRVMEGIDYAYQKYGMDKTLVVTRTNKQALYYNKGIRGHILGREEELESGDWIIIVKNNYSILDPESKIGFLANGDLGTIKRVKKYISDYPLRMVSIEMQLAETEDMEEIDCLAYADLLYSELPQLSEEQQKKQFEVLMGEWGEEEKNQKKLWARLKTDPLANPLQIKFGYALTCHKAQGGQWDAVFVDHGFIKEGPLDTEFYRWLYTAVTRARKELFFIEPDPRITGLA
jgi:ATP-dependent exoDNAse (exonuclease V) alpha subunit